MRILGIETSADETAVCLIEAEGDLGEARITVLGDALYSQIAHHAAFGGIYPNLAKREHAKNIVPLLSRALEQAARGKSEGAVVPMNSDRLVRAEKILEREPVLFHELAEFVKIFPRPHIDAIAVTKGPGLAPALWIGVNCAEALAVLWDIPLYGINHMEGHAVSALIRASSEGEYVLRAPVFPTLALLISGGHTEHVVMDDWTHYRMVGRTRDDAVGEAYDKVARLLGLPYPGGPHISRLADEVRAEGRANPVTLPRPMMRSGDGDFSFSGIKTAVLYMVRKLPEINDEVRGHIAHAFEDAVTEILVEKTKRALRETGAQTFVIGGGVAANRHVRAMLTELLEKEFSDVTLRLPAIALTGDNAIMIATAGFIRIADGAKPESTPLRAEGNLRVAPK